jgi:hypothetical protein
MDDRGEPGRDDSPSADRRIERDLERARAAMARSLSAGKQNGTSRSVTTSTSASTNVTASALVMSGDAVRGEGEDGHAGCSTSVHDEGGLIEGESRC